ncbi:ead/Ea22-like family protein [Escherichia coli]
MSSIDKRELREAAEKATPGPWEYYPGNTSIEYNVDSMVEDQGSIVYVDSGDFTQKQTDLNGAFIAAANPATVLALLDERERNQQYIKRRDQENEEIALTVGKLRVELEETKSKLNEQREYYEGVIADGSKRIAELESNEVHEDGNQFLVVRHPGKSPVIKHCTGDLEEFLRKLIEQDPLVTIDIITHRYYGIGGQWVQDAVEYLHMMSEAGIRIKGE